MAEPVWHRCGWIEASLRYAGRFGVLEKKAYSARFGLTPSMVSRDQDEFRRSFNERCGRVAVVKFSGRLAPVSDGLPERPVFELPRMARWLEEALGQHFEAVLPVQRSEPRPAVLQPLVQAIGARRRLRIEYHSHRSGTSTRTVSPHTILDAAGRLHLRAWDHERSSAKDFVLSRMVSASVLDEARGYVGIEADPDWARHEVLEVRLRPGEDLAAVRPDYELDEDGRALLQVRRAHRVYLLDPAEGRSGDEVGSPVTVRVLDPHGTYGHTS